MNEFIQRLRALLCSAAVVILATSASAQDAQLNTVIVGDQTQVDVAVTQGNGGLVHVWTSDSSAGTDNDLSSIQARRFFGAQFQVNETVTGRQFLPSVAAQDDGRILFVWISDHTAGSSIWARFYAASGTPGSDFQLSTAVPQDQFDPEVSVDPTGGFLVVWDSGTGDADGASIQARRIDGTGSPSGSQFTVNTVATGDQFAPSASFDAGGNVLIVWQSDSGDTDATSIQARLFPTGCAASGCGGSEFTVNTTIAGRQDVPAVASGSSEFVVVWASESSSNARGDTLDSSGYSIQAIRLDLTGAPIIDPGCFAGCDPMVEMCDTSLECEDGNDFQVNTFTPTDQLFPDVAAAPAGNFVVTWDSFGSSGTDDALLSVQSRAFDLDANSEGSDVQVNTFISGSQSDPAIAYNDLPLAPRFEFAWQSRGSSGDDQDGFSIPEPGALPAAITALASLIALRRRRS